MPLVSRLKVQVKAVTYALVSTRASDKLLENSFVFWELECKHPWLSQHFTFKIVLYCIAFAPMPGQKFMVQFNCAKWRRKRMEIPRILYKMSTCDSHKSRLCYPWQQISSSSSCMLTLLCLHAFRIIFWRKRVRASHVWTEDEANKIAKVSFQKKYLGSSNCTLSYFLLLLSHLASSHEPNRFTSTSHVIEGMQIDLLESCQLRMGVYLGGKFWR